MTKKQRLLSLLLAVTMAFSLVVTSACAAETETNADSETQEEMPVIKSVVETIAAQYAESEYPGDWQSFDMAAYAKWKEASGEEAFPTLKESAYTAYIKDAYGAITREGATVTDIAKAEVILNSLGIDSTSLSYDEKEPVNNREKIAAVSEYQTYSDAIWMLFAGGQKTVELTVEQVKGAVDVIEENTNEDGLLFGTYGGYTYTDIDSTGWAVAALSPLSKDEADKYGVKEKASTLIEKMLSALSRNQQENGSFGNTYTDASVICGLCGHGIDPSSDSRFVKGENSLTDGIMVYLNADKTGFSSGYTEDADSWATEQAFRALVAYSAYSENEGEAYNIFTFAAKEETVPDEEKKPEEDKSEEDNPTSKPSTGGLPSGTVTPPDNTEDKETEDKEDTDTEEEDENLITVSFQMNTHKKTWIGRHSVKIAPESTVGELISKVFSNKGAKGDGISSGYLRSVTYKGETLAEFDVGKGSGWCYYVNGDSPRMGINSYKLTDGDYVLLQYVADEEEEEEDSAPTIPTTDVEDDVPDVPQTPDIARFIDLGNYSWATDAIDSLADKGIIKGTGETTFSPEKNITRADFACLLVRAFEKTSDNSENFSDVSATDYFARELAIARNTGLVGGIGDNKFAPRESIKRCDMMLMVYRILKSEEIDFVGDGVLDVPQYSDFDSVPEYAREAVSALIGEGLVNGKGDKIAPLENTTRAEVAVLLQRVLEYTEK